MEWYFIRRLSMDDALLRGATYQIQLLDDEAKAIDYTYFQSEQDRITFEGRQVSAMTLAQARTLPIGQGDFFDALGNRINPFTLEIIRRAE